MSSLATQPNPILPGFNPDPTIIRVNDDFFICTSSFEYFPGVPIYHSTDLQKWKLIGHCLTRTSQLSLGRIGANGGIYAPTLRYHKGRFYMTTTLYLTVPGGPEATQIFLPPRGFYVWTDNICDSSSWSDPIYFDVTGIDQDLFFDHDDRVYLSTSLHLNDAIGLRAEVAVCEINLENGRCLTYPQIISQSKVENETPTAEGSHIFLRAGIYYLVVAEGGTGSMHQEWVYRSRHGVFGPWEVGPKGTVNPMVFNDQNPHVQNTGHLDFVEDKDHQWWAVLLAVRPQHYKGDTLPSQLGRETFICRVEWQDDWPIVNDRKSISIGTQPSTWDENQTFTFRPDADLYLDGWYHLRTPVKQEYDLTLRPGSLALFGGPYMVAAEEAVTMLLQRQKQFDGVWSTDLEFNPDRFGAEAGVTVWCSKWSFSSISIRGSESRESVGREVVFRYPTLGSTEIQETCQPLVGSVVRIRVKADALSYHLQYAVQKHDGSFQDFFVFPAIPARAIVQTREFDSIFTGTHFGLFATGSDNAGSLKPAFFSNVCWTSEKLTLGSDAQDRRG